MRIYLGVMHLNSSPNSNRVAFTECEDDHESCINLIPVTNQVFEL